MGTRDRTSEIFRKWPACDLAAVACVGRGRGVADRPLREAQPTLAGAGDQVGADPLPSVAWPFRLSGERTPNALFAPTRQQRTQFRWIQVTPNVSAICAGAKRLVGV